MVASEDANSELSCAEARDELHSLVCNELTDEEATPVLAHLAKCGECRAVLNQHARLSGILRDEMPSITRTVFSPYLHRYN